MKNTCVLVFDSPKKINAIFECKCVTSVRPDLIIRSESLPLSRKKKKEKKKKSLLSSRKQKWHALGVICEET